MSRLVPALLALGLLACDPKATCPECPDAAPADCPKQKTTVVHAGPAPAVDAEDIKLTFADPNYWNGNEADWSETFSRVQRGY
mgnify:CR=1 FL=1